MNDVDKRTPDSIPVSPDSGAMHGGSDPRQEAGQDKSIAKRLERNPTSEDARLDNALDESMDASDPPAATQPVHRHEPAPSSGYDEAAEAKLRKD